MKNENVNAQFEYKTRILYLCQIMSVTRFIFNKGECSIYLISINNLTISTLSKKTQLLKIFLGLLFKDFKKYDYIRTYVKI